MYRRLKGYVQNIFKLKLHKYRLDTCLYLLLLLDLGLEIVVLVLLLSTSTTLPPRATYL